MSRATVTLPSPSIVATLAAETATVTLDGEGGATVSTVATAVAASGELATIETED